MRAAAGAVAMVLALGACAGSGAPPEAVTEPEGRACRLLTDGEVESFFGEPVRPGSPGERVDPVDDVCRWGDADPASPGRVLSLRLAPEGSVERPQPGADDQVYEAPSLGDGAVGIQRASGPVQVVFEAEGVLVDLAYDVVPRHVTEDDAIDRLIRLAGRVAGRLVTKP